nr:hypothetical protein CFP56_30989 [Quercus suber]
MVTVALAGATTGLGQTVLHTFIHLNTARQHHIVLLSRSPQPHLSAKGVDVRPVDYADPAQLVSALADVHTLISFINSGALLDAQLPLLRAAEAAGVQRFAPSEFAGKGYDGIAFYAPKATVWAACQASPVACTRFHVGLFMSLFAKGTSKGRTEVGVREGRETGQEEALAGLRPWTFVLDMVAGTADLPVDGAAEVVFTEPRDIGRFLFRALDLDTWPEDLGMRGDVASFKEVVALAEKVQQRKFSITENSIQSMEAEMEKNPAKTFYNQGRIRLAEGWGMVDDDLNRAFPDLKPVRLEEWMEKWWGGM